MADGPHHALSTRLWHWLNFACLAVLFMSGLGISNAHPWLYWGESGFQPREAWLAAPRFPDWATIPGYYSLAEARLWHLAFAWPFALGLAFYLVAALLNGHLRRDIAAGRDDWRWSAIRQDMIKHLKLDFSGHDGRYNFAQKLLYGLVLLIGLPLMIVTGLAMSPAMDAAWPWLTQAFGGRQSARSLHFVTAWGLLGFFLIHILAVLLSGPIEQVRAMITGGRKGGQPA
jgi:thiosulfate reductase cytochrome b subunit